jgi:serine/threonine protein kinase
MFVTGNVIFGHYRVVEIIVDAKNSCVIRAIDEDQEEEEEEEEERDVAIKMPREDLEQTNIELMILNALNHEAIIELKDVIWISNIQTHVLILPFARGGDLLTIVHNHGCIQEPDAKIIIFRLLSALEYCHKNAVWHRDIKLKNVLLMLRKSKSNWDVVLGDFGLAFMVNEKCDREFLVLHSIWSLNSGWNSHTQKK